MTNSPLADTTRHPPRLRKLPLCLIGALTASLVPFAAANAQQSSVTLYGVVDASILHGSGSLADKTQMFSGNAWARGWAFAGPKISAVAWRQILFSKLASALTRV